MSARDGEPDFCALCGIKAGVFPDSETLASHVEAFHLPLEKRRG